MENWKAFVIFLISGGFTKHFLTRFFFFRKILLWIYSHLVDSVSNDLLVSKTKQSK